MGRPTKLTPELQRRIVKAVRCGNYGETAAASEGVDRATYYRWMERGAAGEDPFRDFCDAVTRARAIAERRMVNVVRTDATQNAESARWYLERSASDRWGRRDKLTIESAVNAELDAMLAKLEAGLSPEEYDRVLAVLTSGSAGAEASSDPQREPVSTH
jgi:hypothetical protein